MSKTLYIFDPGLKGLVGHYYEYDRSIVEAARDAGIQCVVGCHEQAGDGSFASFELQPVFRDDVWATLPDEDYHSAVNMNGVSGRFMEDIQEIVVKHRPQPGDIMFLPNIAKPHLVVASLLAETFGSMGVRTLFMFRYPRSHFEGRTAADAFRLLERAAANYDVSLCTDSHRLSDNLAPLSSLPFTVFPIPHTWHGQAGPRASSDLHRPLHCVSLGNARDEKGMAEILEAVRLSSHESWGEGLRFTLQVNDPYQVEDAIDAFRKGPADPRVVLVDEPLGSDEYAALLQSADVVLTPYWRSIYAERTSGIFLEGLISGKLVLCTRNTWMSDLFDHHGGGVAVDDRSGPAVCEGLRKLVEKRELLQERARHAAAYWRAVHCPENFLAHLAGENARTGPDRPGARRGKAAVLFPWGEAVSGKTGAALRLKYFVRYMETAHDEVRVLFTGGGEPGGVIGEKSLAEPHHYSDGARQLHEQLKAICRSVGAPEEDCFHLWYHLWPNRDPVFALRCEEMVLWADHVYVDYTYFVPLVDSLCRKHGKNYTLTVHDVVAEQAARTPFLHAATRALEFDAARRAPRVICASAVDRTALENAGIQAEIIPHPIDALEAMSPFSLDEALAILQDLYDLPVKGRRLCFFVGSHYPPNVEAAEAIADMARRCESDPRLRNVFFVVAGACMNPCTTKNFAALGIIEGAALSACMSLSDVVLIPLLRGTGVSLKCVEALARGSLIVSTAVGMRGLDVEDGIHCRIEDDISRFPDRIVELFADDDGSQRMREAARHFGEQFDFRRIMALYVAGSSAADAVETEEEFAVRRRHAIEELLPRLDNVRKLSPRLSTLKKESDEPRAATGANALEAEVSKHDAPEHLQQFDVIPEGFDAEWYIAAYPDVAMLGMSPAGHYNWIGRVLGRAPNGRGRGDAQSEHLPFRKTAAGAPSTSGRRWFLADPSLVSSSGHCARYLSSIAAPLRERGDIVHILGNHRLQSNAADLAGCEPAFTLKCEEAPLIPNVDPTSPPGIERLARRRAELLCGDLNRLVEKYGIGQSDVVLINSLRHWSLESVLEWLERIGASRAPTVAVVLHYTPYPQPDVPDPAATAYRSAFRRIARSPLGSRIILCTDSERLRAEYCSLYDVPITLLPVPHCFGPLPDRRADEDRLSIAFAGEARSDKGFHLLPPAIGKVLSSAPRPNVVFNIQAYRPDESELEAAWTDLPLGDVVRILPEPLSEAEYESFIRDADLILLPYRRGPYRAQTSGVYCEAAALGIPVVVPSGTWMADQVSKNGGGVLFEPGDAVSLANACLEAIRNYPSLREEAKQAAPAWRAFHAAPSLIACLEASLGGLRTSRAA